MKLTWWNRRWSWFVGKDPVDAAENTQYLQTQGTMPIPDDMHVPGEATRKRMLDEIVDIQQTNSKQ